jgi:GTP-binding protein SAR1
VDAADHGRFPEARAELEKLLTDERLSKVPFLVMGNKVDLDVAASDAELRSSINLMETTGRDADATKLSGVRPIELFMVSLKTRFQVKEAFDWLSACLK